MEFTKNAINSLRKLIKSNNFLQIIFNVNWLALERILRLIFGVFVGAWVARYLGPEKYGVFNYSIAFVTLFSALSTLGLDNVVIKELVNQPNNKNTILGSTFFLKSIGSSLLVLVTYLSILFFKQNDNQLRIFILIISTSYLFKSLDVIDFWFQSKVQSKYISISKIISLIIISLMKIYLVYFKLDLIYFISTILIDAIIIAILFAIFYKMSNETFFNWKIDKEFMLNLLHKSWPLALSGLAIVIYMRIGQIMIGEMEDLKNLGIYSAATRLLEIFYFLPLIISGSIFPAIIKKSENEKELNRIFYKSYKIFMIISLLIAISISLSSTVIIKILFGEEYIYASKILTVHIWAFLFVFLGVQSSKFLILKNYTKIALYRTLIGSFTNVILSYILIKKIGIIGAAWATLITYFTSAFSILFFKKTFNHGVLMLRSILFLKI